MVRLFLKFYGVLIATLIFSFVVQMQLMSYVWSEMSAGYDFRVRFQPTFHLVEEALAPLPREQWQARFRELAEGFGTPARLAAARETPELPAMTPEQAAQFERGAMVSVDRPEGFTVAKRLMGGEQVMALDIPAPDRRRMKVVTYVVNWAVEFTVVAILVWFWVRPFWRELLSLRRAADQVGAGHFEARAEVGRSSVLRALSESFTAMAEQVACLLQSHRTLTSAVSHELRTPIARLRFSHSLAREEATAEGKQRLLARMEADIAEIDELTSELLDYARLERGAPAMHLQNVPAEPWLEDVLADARSHGEEAPRPIVFRADVETETVRCEPRYMARAVANLVRNARTHARSAVVVSLRREHERNVIHVDDDGPGIDAGDRERLFEPFERADRSRGRESGGFGLGLAIVRQVARWHGGDACIADSPLGGTRVTIAW
jgi:two-component system, OmpR family, sensor kinase ParS